MTLSLERINKAREAGYDDDAIIQSIEKRDPEFGARISKARESGYDSSMIMQSIEKKLNTPVNTPVNPLNTPAKDSIALQKPDIALQKQGITPSKSDNVNPLYNAFASGLKESASGEISRQVFGDKSPDEIAQDPGFWEQLVHSGGTIAGDTPYLLAGGSLGAALGSTLGSVGGPIGTALGGVAGAGFGSMALPAFIKEALKEYRDYSDKGNDLTFGEFLSRADNVASKTLKEGAFGVILGAINKAGPLLQKIPGLGSLFTSKIAQKAGTIGGETVAAATIPAASEGRLPTKNDFAQAAALVLGFNLAHLPAEIRDHIEKRGIESGKTPEEFAKTPEAKEIINEATKEIDQKSEVQVKQPETETNQKTEAPKENVKPLYNEKKAGGEDFSKKSKVKKSELRAQSKNLALQKKKQPEVKPPIIETTGQNAEQRLEEPPTRLGKLKEKVSNAIESVKNPTELSHKIYTKAFDALEPINRLEKNIPVEERVTTKIKQAQSAASDVNNVLTQGIFDNVSDKFTSGSLSDVYLEAGDLWKKTTKGLKDGDFSVQEMDVYRTSKEALKRQKKGLKSGIDTAIAEKDVSRLKQKYSPVDQRLQKFQENTLEHYGKDLLGDEVIDQWTQESHASLYRVMDYGSDAVTKEGSLAPKKPWHKAKGSGRKIIPPSESDIQNLSMLITNSKKNDSVVQYKKLVAKGQLPGKIVKSKNKEVPSKMMEDLEIDPQNSALAETLYNQSRKDAFTPQKNRIKGWEDGKPFEIEVPPDVYETYSSMAPSDNGMFTKIFKTTNNLMSRGIVLEPRKFVSIVGRDALSSLIYSKTGSNPISIVRALTDIYKDSHSWNQFKSLGGEQYVSRLMTRTDRAAKIEELIKANDAKMISFSSLGKFLSDFNGKLAASVPFAEYQRSVEKYGDTPSGRLQALINAKNVSYDPTKKGSSKLVKDAANFMPFFNVMLQEPAMIAKHLSSPQFIAKGILGITLPSLLLHLYNTGNPDYDDMNPVLKASCWHFYTEDGGHYACPVPWLLGATFKSAPEAFYDMLQGNDEDAFKGLYSYVASQLSGSFPPILQALVEQTTERSLPNPAGVAIMPFASVDKRAPPVVPKRLENKPPEEQYTSKTSQLARWYGKMWNASPVKVERLIRTFGGGLASDTLALIDEVAYQTGLAEDLRPAQGASNYLLLGNFFKNSTPTNTKYTEQFYNQLNEAQLNKQRDKPNDLKRLQGYNKRISANFKKYRDIEESRIDAHQKKDKLDAIQKEINSLYKEAVTK